MPPTLAEIHVVLRSLSRRRRALMAASALSIALAGGALAWSLLAVAANLGLATRNHGAAWIVVVALVPLAGLAYRLRGWSAAAQLRAQALRLEALLPELRGALLTVLDRSSRPLGSPVLVERLATGVAPTIRVPPSRAWPARPLARDLGVAVGALALLAVFAFTLPRGPIDTLRFLLGSNVASLTTDAPPADGPRAVIGDIRLRYLYPTYTRLEPLLVPNSSGAIHAPPGTVVEISARSAEPWSAARFVVYEQAPQPVARTDGREISARLTVAAEGTWRAELDGVPTPDFAIVPDPDLAPDVTLQVPTRKLALNADGLLRASYAVRDDYGIRTLVVQVRQGGRTREVPQRSPLDMPRSLAGALDLSPETLGLRPGDHATLRLGAWDNDEVSGSKAGWSAAFDIEVLGAEGRAARDAQAWRDFREVLVPILADSLVEPAPVTRDRAQALAWGALADARYLRFDALVDRVLPPGVGGGFLGTMVGEVQRARRAVVSYARSVGEGEGELRDADAERFSALQGEHILAVEDAILLVDQLLRRAALDEVARLATEVAREAAELREDLPKLGAAQALARLDQLSRLYQELMKEAAKLDSGTVRDFIADRGAEMQAMLDEIRKAIAEGRMEDARKLMERLAAMMEEMAGGLEEMREGGQAEENQLGEAMKELQEELSRLEQEQAALREQTRRENERLGPEMKAAEERWKKVERLAGEASSGLGSDALRSTGERSIQGAMQDAADAAKGLVDSARARDLRAALQRADNLVFSITRARSRVTAQVRRGALEDGERIVAALDAPLRAATEALELLQQMEQAQARSSPELQQRLKELAGQQQRITEGAQAAAERSGEISRQLPMRAPGLGEGTREAVAQSSRAESSMDEGDGLSAEGAQQAVEEGLRRAQEALDKAQRELEQMRQASSGRGGSDEGRSPEDEGDADGYESAGGAVIPAPEEFETPEAYRRALLEGMNGVVPEQYKSSNRRYYEELVRQ